MADQEGFAVWRVRDEIRIWRGLFVPLHKYQMSNRLESVLTARLRGSSYSRREGWKMDCTAWESYFAVFPVRVDAYEPNEIKNGKMSYFKVGWVERQFCQWIDDDDDRTEIKVWRYRLPRK
jgi:hypothetical protein